MDKRKHKRGQLLLKCLRILGEVSLGMGELALVLATSRYGASSYEIQKNLRELRKSKKDVINEIKKEKRYYDLVYRLKRQGLIKIVDKKIEITKKGEKILTKKSEKDLLPDSKYSLIKTKEKTIVAFDIPEKYEYKRKWLRAALRNLEFNMVQKSVWMGEGKLPEELIKDMHDVGILENVHIFVVIKSGTLV